MKECLNSDSQQIDQHQQKNTRLTPDLIEH